MRNIPQHILDRAEESSGDSLSEVRKTIQWIRNSNALDEPTVNNLLEQLKGSKGKMRLLQHSVIVELLGRVVEALHTQKRLIADIEAGALYSSMDKKVKQLEGTNKFIAEGIDAITRSTGVPDSNTDMMDTLNEALKGKTANEYEEMTPESRERLRQALEEFVGDNKPKEPVTFGNE